MRDWWTEKDAVAFDSRASKIVEQFNKYVEGLVSPQITVHNTMETFVYHAHMARCGLKAKHYQPTLTAECKR